MLPSWIRLETNQGLESRWEQSVFTEKWFRGTHLVQNLKWNYTLSMVSRHWENLILENSCFWNYTKITRPILKLLQNAVFKKLPFCCPLVNFGPLSREQVHSPDVNNCVLSVWLKRQREPRDWVGSVSPAVRLMGFKPVTSIHSQRFNSLGQPQPPLPPTLHAEVPNVRFNRLGVVFSCYERERTKNGSFAVIFPQLWSV